MKRFLKLIHIKEKFPLIYAQTQRKLCYNIRRHEGSVTDLSSEVEFN